ncbi:MAG TPA: secretin N-terminal domain-containing protein [Candidatus Binatia bacterium]|jgi:general secretion pathway protein D
MDNKIVISLLVILLTVIAVSGWSGPAQAQPVPAPEQPLVPPVPGQLNPAPAAPGQPGPAPVMPTPPLPIAPERRLSPPPSGGMVSLNFTRADLVEIIHILAQHLRLTYTIDPEVKGTVTINSAEPLRAEDLLPIFHQILRMNGAVAIKTGNLYHIMPIKDAKGLARPVGQNQEDSFALRIVPVRFFSVAEMKKVLTPFLRPGGEIIENPRGNFLIIMDLPSNIQRLVEIADLIDVQVFAGTRMEIYQPRVASAEELAQEMTKVMQSFAASSAQTDNFAAEFIPLPRINQLLVISHSEAAWTYAKRWLDRIDVVAEGPGRRIFIYAVENGKAEDLADVLNQALGQASTATRSRGPTLQDLHRSTAGAGSQSTGTSSGFGSSTSGFGNTNSTMQGTLR